MPHVSNDQSDTPAEIPATGDRRLRVRRASDRRLHTNALVAEAEITRMIDVIDRVLEEERRAWAPALWRRDS